MKRPFLPSKPEWDLLFPLLIDLRRTLLKLPAGPADRFQTREFRSLIEDIEAHRHSSEDLSSREALSAYFLYEWPLRYAEGLSLLKELPQPAKRVLEIGAKGAPFSFAASQYGALEVFALDENEEALRRGAQIFGHFGYPVSVRKFEPMRPLPVTGSWDLIILPYTLFSRFTSVEDRLSYLKRLMPLLSETGHLLLVESSESSVNREFLALRDAIFAEGISIAAPCLGIRKCPALRHGSSACYAQRPLEEKPFILKEIQRALNIKQNSLKMSYLLLRSPKSSAPEIPENLYRVISPPVETYKGTRRFLCGTSRQVSLGTGLQEHPKASKAFEYLKRGDVIAIENASEIEDDLVIKENTSVILYAPCDKPVLK